MRYTGTWLVVSLVVAALAVAGITGLVLGGRGEPDPCGLSADGLSAFDEEFGPPALLGDADLARMGKAGSTQCSYVSRSSDLSVAAIRYPGEAVTDPRVTEVLHRRHDQAVAGAVEQRGIPAITATVDGVEIRTVRSAQPPLRTLAYAECRTADGFWLLSASNVSGRDMATGLAGMASDLGCTSST